MNTLPAPTKHHRNENFPVASWLLPKTQRSGVMALYRFARCADDLADEGLHTPEHRQQQLQLYRADLDRALQGQVSATWPEIFTPLAAEQTTWQWPVTLLHDLLTAFEMDVHHQPMASEHDLLHYCRYSANPVGRLLLHMFVPQPLSNTLAAQSDAICTALQLINFWQDLAGDISQGRHYLPLSALQRVGLERCHVDSAQALKQLQHPHTLALQHALHQQLNWAETLLWQGSPLAWTLSQTAGQQRWGWELRTIVQGAWLRLRQLRLCINDSHSPLWLQRPALPKAFVLRTALHAALWPVTAPQHPFAPFLATAPDRDGKA